MAFKVYLVRHGQTMLNRYNKLQGWCDSHLTENGVNQAKAAGRHLAHIKFDRIYYSGMMRTLKTSQVIASLNDYRADLPKPVADPDFREQGFGYFEGTYSDEAWFVASMPHGARTLNDIITKYSLAATMDMLKEADPFHDAESADEFWQRIEHGLTHLRQEAKDDQKILVVGHSVLIRYIIAHVAPEIDIVNNRPRNGSVTCLSFDKDKISVDYYNHHRDDEQY